MEKKMDFLKLGKHNDSKTEDLREERSRLIHAQSDSRILDTYKSLRKNVMFSLVDESESKVILVTSAAQGEGKTITAANLATSFALDGKKVLLIDCDMRHPKLDELMELHSEVGLSNILMQPELCACAVANTPEKRMKVLLAGDVPPNPAELLGTARMAELLDALKQQFDYIILDTPPMKEAEDALALCPLTDGALFVVRSGGAKRGMVTDAVKRIQNADTKFLGFVLTGTKGEESCGEKPAGGSQNQTEA